MTVVGVALLALSWFVSPTVFNVLFGLIIIHSFASVLARICDRPWLAPVVLFAGITCMTVILLRFPEALFWPYLAIVFANFCVAYVFGNRLVQKKSSILRQFVDIAYKGPEPSDKFVVFLERQCITWIFFALISVVLSCVAMIGEHFRPLINLLLVVLVILQAVWFVGSHKIANKKYGRPERWQETLQLMFKRDLWAKLEI